jgi:hypothetical protein
MSVGHSLPVSLRKQHPKEYDAWKAMRSRCYNPRNASWKYYGAKGITVCERWRTSFAAFFEDLGPAPSPSHSIERDKNHLGYEPGNVRWATPSEQAHNTSKCRWITHNGRTMLAGDWAKETGIATSTIKSRIDDFGWTAEKALTTPVYATASLRRKSGPLKNTKRQVTHNGETRSAHHWARTLGITLNVIYYQLRAGRTIEDIIKRSATPTTPQPV